MPLTVAGISHDTASLEIRERLSISASELHPTLRRVRGEAEECVILSTCNRFEVYALLREGANLRKLLPNLTSAQVDELRPYVYSYHGVEAIRHLFKVAAGVDSLIVGEVQILGQVQRAWQAAHQARSVGPILSQLFHKAVALGKRVYSETSINRLPASVSYAAVALARQIFGQHLDSRRVLVIGTGEVGEGVLRCLHEYGVRATVIAHRQIDRAYSIARRYDAEVALWEAMPQHLASTDIVISSTSAPHIVLQRQHIEDAMHERQGQPLYLIDLAVPRDVDPAASELPAVHLHNIDYLQAVVRATLEERQSSLPQVEAMIDAETARFSDWLKVRSIVPAIRMMQGEATHVAKREMEWALSKMPYLAPKERQIVEAMAARIVGKLMHGPIQLLKAQALEGIEPEYNLTAEQVAGLFYQGTVEAERTEENDASRSE